MAGSLIVRGSVRVGTGAVLSQLWQQRQLLRQLAWREVQSRYRGSWLGVLWSLLTPLLTLGLYTFVFSVVFESRWEAGKGTEIDFALNLFAGLIVFNLFAETVNAAPGLIINNPTYVKRVVFPLEMLPLARLLSSLVQAGFSLTILLAGALFYRGAISGTLLLLPLALLPILLFTLGVSYFLASLGVFVRDIGNLVGLVTTALLFLSPVMYPLSRLPPDMQPMLAFNPLVAMLENFRRVVLESAWPEWGSWGAVSLVGLILCWAGLGWFLRSKSAFADVL